MTHRSTLFVHVPKAAGSTVRETLARNYAKDHRVSFDQDGPTDFEPIARSRALDLIVGHFRFGLHTSIARPVSYITMVRNPIERYISDYFYAYSQPTHRDRERILSGSLPVEKFLREDADPFAMIRQLTGLDRLEDIEKPGIAEEIATQSYSAIGISERFDESILILAHICGWGVPLAFPRNRTLVDDDAAKRRRAFLDRIPPDVVHRFARDQQFYDACVDWLDEAIASVGPRFQRALASYRAIQAEILSVIERDHASETFRQTDFGRDADRPQFIEKFVRTQEFFEIEDFLFSETPLRARQPSLLHGHIDSVKDGILRGWALRYGSRSPVRVMIVPKDRPSFPISAERDRPELLRFGFPHSRHGFEIDLGRQIKSRGDVAVYFDGTSLPLSVPASLNQGAS